MQFVLTFAVLGDIFSAMQGFNEIGFQSKDEGQDVHYTTVFSLEDDEIELSLLIPHNVEEQGKNTISMADGILFYLDPNQTGNIEKLQDVLDLIEKIRPDIPMIIVIQTMEVILKADISEIIKTISFRSSACIFIISRTEIGMIREYLITLCQSVISGQRNINTDIAWIQKPLYYSKINEFISQSKFLSAAVLCERVINIQKHSDSQDYYILAEKTANLYAKSGNYLKAAQIIRSINPIFFKKYQKDYANTIIEEAKVLFSQNKYESAALKFETVGNWIKMELDDTSLMEQCYKLAIDAWIAQHELQNAFALLDKFDHFRMITILEEMTEKIAHLADQLIEKDQDGLAKAQLYLCFQRYQKSGLFESLQVLARKAVKILKRIIIRNLNIGDVDTARLSYDELTTIWETYNIEAENIDEILYNMAKLFIERRDFLKAEGIIPKIHDTILQIELTKYRMETEENFKNLARKGELEELGLKTDLLFGYIEYEKLKFDQMLEDLYQDLNFELQHSNFQFVEEILLKKADWFSQIGQENYNHQIILYFLKINLNNGKIEKIIKYISKLPEIQRKKFLKDEFPQLKEYFDRMKFTDSNKTSEETEKLLFNFVRIYRNHLLYEESRLLAKLYLEELLAYAELISHKIEVKGLSTLFEQINKIDLTSKSYLENEEINLDSIYITLVKYYLKNQFYSEARTYAEKISNFQLSQSYCEKIDEIESELNRSKVEQIQQNQKVKIFAERLSQLQNRARDQRIASVNLLRMRTGLKRRYYQDAIKLFREGKYYKSIEKYLQTAEDLAASKKFELAGVNIAVVSLLFLTLKNVNALKHEIHKFTGNSRVSFDIFKKTYAYQLIDYLIQMIEANKPQQLKSALQLFDVFAFFPEERLILETLLGEEIDFSRILSGHQEILSKTKSTIPSNYSILIEKLYSDIQLKNRRISFDLKYWGDCQDHFARQEYEDASVSYFEQSLNMFYHNYYEFSIVSIIMGFLTLLKVKTSDEVYHEFEKFVFQHGKKYGDLMSSVPIQLLELVLHYWEHPDSQNMILDIFNAFQTKLPLFDWEISFLIRLTQKFQKEDKKFSDKKSQRVGSIQVGKSLNEDSLLGQQVIVLIQDITKLSNEFSLLLKKREKMIRTYYQEIFDDLSKNLFKEAFQKYIKLSKRMARRNDYTSASLMIFLSTLCLIHENKPISEIQTQLDEVLNGLGLVKKILEDHFGVKLAFFTLDVLQSNNSEIKTYLRNIFEKLPLLPSEKQLIKI
ncbi:hypothetical protein [Candidatus Harpocratesius sp.]